MERLWRTHHARFASDNAPIEQYRVLQELFLRVDVAQTNLPLRVAAIFCRGFGAIMVGEFAAHLIKFVIARRQPVVVVLVVTLLPAVHGMGRYRRSERAVRASFKKRTDRAAAYIATHSRLATIKSRAPNPPSNLPTR